MFFILSKILSFLTTPVTWVSALLLSSLLIKNPARKRIVFISGILTFFLFSNSFLLDEAMRRWEVPATHYRDLGTYEAGIVLGGLLTYDAQYDRIQFYRGTDRLLQAVELYKRGVIRKILFVGGSGSLEYPDMKEAPLVKRFLTEIGIPAEDLLSENESRNTHENAVFARPILEKNNIRGNCLLLSSGFHLRRAASCFRKTGISVIPYSTDRYSGPRIFRIYNLLLPSSEALFTWEILFHEWIGYMVYKIQGYA